MSAAKSTKVLNARPITPRRVRHMQRTVKREWGWSASKLAARLGISRPHLKRLESGTRGISEMVAVHFRSLEREVAEYYAETHARERNLPTVLTRYALPARLEILARPRKCPVCKWHFVAAHPQQKFCGTTCRNAARTAQRKRARAK